MEGQSKEKREKGKVEVMALRAAGNRSAVTFLFSLFSFH
jgi:hypothetical protein